MLKVDGSIVTLFVAFCGARMRDGSAHSDIALVREETDMSFVDADEAIGQLKHVVAQADDDELCVLRPLLDVVSHNRHVFEIKGCINLVHEVQRCRFEMMESENECQ